MDTDIESLTELYFRVLDYDEDRAAKMASMDTASRFEEFRDALVSAAVVWIGVADCPDWLSDEELRAQLANCEKSAAIHHDLKIVATDAVWRTDEAWWQGIADHYARICDLRLMRCDQFKRDAQLRLVAARA
jgi:hypothetical protein